MTPTVRLSVVVPTRNEERNIGACLGALRCPSADRFRSLETIVVDNASEDRTCEIAAAAGARVFAQGPERCAQRNRGLREATGDWVLFLDADMTLDESALAEIAARAGSEDVDAYYVPEVRDGRGFRARARNFERSFYNGTCIDGLRLLRRELLLKAGGYDEDLVACEDWDLDRRLVAAGAKTAILTGHLVHHEGLVPLKRLLAKKAYYSASIGRYRAKWHEDATIRRQFGLGYRFFGVFVENGKWKKVLRHPILFAGVLFERFAVGLTYLLNR